MMTTMKHQVLRAAAVALFVAGLSATVALAQDAPPPPPATDQTQGPPAGSTGGRGGNPERRMEMLQKQLKLSPDQATQMKAILDDQRAKMESLRSNTSLTQQDRRSQMMTMHQDEETKIHAVLTPDQQKKYDDMEAKMRERMQERRTDGAQMPPPPSV